MKGDTQLLALKAACYVIIGAGASLVSGLSQWANEGTDPPKLQWLIIITSSVTAGVSQLLSFLSASYSDWQKNRSTQ